MKLSKEDETVISRVIEFDSVLPSRLYDILYEELEEEMPQGVITGDAGEADVWMIDWMQEHYHFS